MNSYRIKVEVPEGKIKEILDRLTKAQEEICACYYELEELGVLTIKEETASGN